MTVGLQADMPRVQVTLRIDKRLIDLEKKLAEATGLKISAAIEARLIAAYKSIGLLPEDFEPLGETRGGDTSKFRKNKKGTSQSKRKKERE